MSPLYPEESKKLDVIAHLEELRKRMLISLSFLFLAAIVFFIKGNYVFPIVVKPAQDLIDELIFISPTEAFVSYLKISLLCGFILSFPVIIFHVWRYLSPAFNKRMRRRIVVWLVMALFLFFSGIAFSYFLAFPTALKFLISFGEKIATPMISLGKYISFFGAIILIGGVIFEIPVIMGLLGDAGIVTSKTLKAKRHIAVLAIMVVAAVITPTQDIINMLLFAVPMIILYEIGIFLVSRLEGRTKDRG